MNPEAAAVLVPLAGIAMIVIVMWLVIRAQQSKVQAQTELHKHLLDKFGSGAELAEFLETDGGKKMIEDLGRGNVSPKERALRPMITGTVLTCLGAAFLLLTFRVPDFVIPGGIILAIGIGFLIGAFVMLRLSKNLNADKERSADAQTATEAHSVGSSNIT
jgi:ABC-type antimicrobial peptide transport system permease subunit